jgi:cytosine/uracil/thiamine/allantoin permease
MHYFDYSGSANWHMLFAKWTVYLDSPPENGILLKRLKLKDVSKKGLESDGGDMTKKKSITFFSMWILSLFVVVLKKYGWMRFFVWEEK